MRIHARSLYQIQYQKPTKISEFILFKITLKLSCRGSANRWFRHRSHRASIKRLLSTKMPTPQDQYQMKVQLQKEKTYHPRSAPPLKKVQSPFFTQVHPPPTPFPIHAGTPSARRSCDPSASTPEGSIISFSFPRRRNVLSPAVNTKKSSSDVSSGMRPVNTRPIAISDAA